MRVHETFNVLTKEIDFVFDAAALQLTFRAPVFEGVFSEMKHDEEVGHFNPVVEERNGVGVFSHHRQGLQIPIVAVARGSWHLRWH